MLNINVHTLINIQRHPPGGDIRFYGSSFYSRRGGEAAS